MNSREKEDFSRILNVFLSSTFVTRGGDLRRDYYFVKRYFAAFEGVFRILGWSLTVDDAYGVAFVVSPYGQTHLRLNAIQSVVLLTLRLIYEEARKDLNPNDSVVVTVDDLQSRLQAFKVTSRPLDKKALRECIALLKKYNVLGSLDSDVTDPSTRLIISPAILFAVRIEDLDQVKQSLEALLDRERGGSSASRKDSGSDTDGAAHAEEYVADESGESGVTDENVDETEEPHEF